MIRQDEKSENNQVGIKECLNDMRGQYEREHLNVKCRILQKKVEILTPSQGKENRGGLKNILPAVQNCSLQRKDTGKILGHVINFCCFCFRKQYLKVR